MKTIHYSSLGHGFPIVWIPGFPLTSAIFEPQLAIPGFRHIRLDLPGFGMTPGPPGKTSMSSYARDVFAVMDDAGVDRAVIAGFSMGGYVAMQMLRDAPRRFAALLLLDTRETPDTAEGKAARLQQAEEVRQYGTGGVVAAMLPKMVFREKSDAVRGIMERATPAGVIAALEAMADRPDSTTTLRQIEVPTLVVVGDRDTITPPADAERMAASIPGAELAPIAQAAHMAHFERPAQVNPLIAAFLMRHVIRNEHADTV